MFATGDVVIICVKKAARERSLNPEYGLNCDGDQRENSDCQINANH